MKTFTTLVAAAALAATTGTSVSAQAADATANPNDPFVSTAGPALGLTPGLIAADIAITIIGIVALDSSDGS